MRRWQRPLLNLAYRFCRDRTLAEDMVQEAFLRLHRKLDRYDGRARFSSWMFTVATRVFISEARRVRPGWLFTDEETLARTGGPEGDPDSGMRDELVRRAVLALPEKYECQRLTDFLQGDIIRHGTRLDFIRSFIRYIYKRIAHSLSLL